MFSDTCDLLAVGHHFKFTSNEKELEPPHGVADILEDINFNKPVSAFEVHEKKKKKKKGKSSNSNTVTGEPTQSSNPIKLLQEMARKYLVQGLAKR